MEKPRLTQQELQQSGRQRHVQQPFLKAAFIFAGTAASRRLRISTFDSVAATLDAAGRFIPVFLTGIFLSFSALHCDPPDATLAAGFFWDPADPFLAASSLEAFFWDPTDPFTDAFLGDPADLFNAPFFGDPADPCFDASLCEAADSCMDPTDPFCGNFALAFAFALPAGRFMPAATDSAGSRPYNSARSCSSSSAAVAGAAGSGPCAAGASSNANSALGSETAMDCTAGNAALVTPLS